jgi:hypothetical protein
MDASSMKRAFQRTPLFPVYAHLRDWVRTLRGQPPLPPPLPPPALIELVAGSPDGDWFLKSGRMGAESITAILEKNGLALQRMSAFLDFGCGVGRVLRHWSDVEGPRMHGSDYNPALIAWCRANLRFANFNVNPLHGALPGTLRAEDITPETIEAHLDTAGLPDPDLILRTSGEHRVSGFLPWQSAYSEFAFVDSRWPDFTAEMFAVQVRGFGRRERRFGAVAG